MTIQMDFINSIKSGAIKSMKKHDVLASITIAQAILESDWGRSQLAREYHNLFGVKAFSDEKYVELPTHEWVRGNKITINAKFRRYDNYEQSIEDHALFLVDNPRYRKNGFFDSRNYVDQANSLVKAGYATDPNYAKSLIQLIKQYKLYEYDSLDEFYRNLKYTIPCMNGNDVKEVQTVLKKLKFLKGNVDGIFGPNTQNAVVLYQKEHKFLNQHGIVDKMTWKSIMCHK